MTLASLPPESLQLHIKQSGRLMAAGAGAVRRIPAGFMEPMAWAAQGRGQESGGARRHPHPSKRRLAGAGLGGVGPGWDVDAAWPPGLSPASPEAPFAEPGLY